MSAERPVYYLDGESLTPEMVILGVAGNVQLMELGYGKYKLDLSKEAWAKVDVQFRKGIKNQNGRKVVDDIVENKIVKYHMYNFNILFNKNNIIIRAQCVNWDNIEKCSVFMYVILHMTKSK